MIKALASILLLTVLSSAAQKTDCPSRTVSKDARPHGANEVVEIDLGTVRKIHGQVIDPSGEPVDAVIEVYRYGKTAKEYELYQISQVQKRQTACATDKDGKFCLAGLSSGSYVLVIGTREPDGLNGVFARVTINHEGEDKDLEIKLSLGT